MSLFVLPVAATAIVTVAAFLVTTTLLWTAGRLLKVADLRYRRVALAVFVSLVVAAVLQVGWIALERWDRAERNAPRPPNSFPQRFDGQPQPEPPVNALAVVGSVVTVVAVWLVLKVLLRVSFGRAALLWLTALIPGAVVSWVLALGFREYIAEHYVVPLGSMAPTLIGVHSDISCSECGWSYSVSGSRRSDPFDQTEGFTTRCPNCGQPRVMSDSAPVYSGDRISVSRLHRPRRWDLVTFAPPDAPDVVYVKRLVGLPGERIALSGGDVFVDGRRLRKRLTDAPELWFPVHDTSYVAPRESTIGWQPEGAPPSWQRTGAQWSCAARGEPQMLVFAGLSNRLAFNDSFETPIPLNPVVDVRVELTLGELTGDGALRCEWRFDDLSAAITLRADESAVLEVRTGSSLVSSSKSPVDFDLPLVMDVRDGWFNLSQDGRLLTDHEILPSELSRANRMEPQPSCQLRLVAADCTVSLSRILVQRDIHYIVLERDFRLPRRAGFGNDPLAEPDTGEEVVLTGTQFWVLGDNTEFSKDSRDFGPVESDAITGAVGCVYWPPSRWRRFDQANGQGDMRRLGK